MSYKILNEDTFTLPKKVTTFYVITLLFELMTNIMKKSNLFIN